MNKYYELGRNIIKTLLDNHYQAYFVGGFVRDFILGIEPNDIDITTNALPEQVEALFEKTRATGKRYGTVTVFKGAYSFEVTTFRAESDYVNHRKPTTIEYSDNIEEDLIRRDFTINAFAMDYSEEIVDLFEGKKDLENNLIRAIGIPNDRFNEDALRILRAFRFVSKLNFDIEEQTFISMKDNMKLLKYISNERVLMELRKICAYPYAQKALSLLEKSHFSNVFTEFDKALKLLSKTEDYRISYLELIALGLILEDIDLPDYWKLSNKEIAIIDKMIELHAVTQADSFNEMIIYRLGKDIPLMTNSVNKLMNPDNDQEALINDIYDNLPIHKTCDLAFKGQDILELTTLRNAELIGDIIDDITYMVITHQLNNNYDDIKKYTLELMENTYDIK